MPGIGIRADTRERCARLQNKKVQAEIFSYRRFASDYKWVDDHLQYGAATGDIRDPASQTDSVRRCQL